MFRRVQVYRFLAAVFGAWLQALMISATHVAVAVESSPTALGPVASQVAWEQPVAPSADPVADPTLAREPGSELFELEQALERPAVAIAPAMQQEVTTVSGQQSSVGRSPAAIFVVTQEMIRRSGATCIPEVLRMVPGLQVARISANQWSITSRGFSTVSGDIFTGNTKLLILIDGRSVYSPLIAGVNWDVQDVVLEDIERIEVIRGPGATIWGANAVNGVINVITKRASDTQGGLIKAGGGSFENGFVTGRHGGQATENIHYRVYGKWFDRGTTRHLTGPQFDKAEQGRGGFRVDMSPNDIDVLTMQGDYYEGSNGLAPSGFNRSNLDEEVQGGNVLSRWTRTFNEDNDCYVQLYYDRADRWNMNTTFAQEINTIDATFQHHLRLNDVHNFVWGLGYRSISDKLPPITPTPVFFFVPEQRTYDTASCFVQDEMTLLADEIFLTLGIKILTNAFTGLESQPSARLLWSPEATWAAWASVSRAVRTPSRLEDDLQGRPIFAFAHNMESEYLLAYEIGYREQPVEWFSWDVALFFNQYNDLTSLTFRNPSPVLLPVTTTNDMTGEGYGFEISGTVDVTPWWKLSSWYSYLQLEIHPGPTVIALPRLQGVDIEQLSPRNQVFLMSTLDLSPDVDFDVLCRYVDNLRFESVRSYISLDMRLAWRPNRNWELAAVGQNLLDAQHLELRSATAAPSNTNEIPRGVYGTVTRTW